MQERAQLFVLRHPGFRPTLEALSNGLASNVNLFSNLEHLLDVQLLARCEDLDKVLPCQLQ